MEEVYIQLKISSYLNSMDIAKGKGAFHHKWVMRKILLFGIPKKVHIFSLKCVFLYYLGALCEDKL